MSVCVYCHCNVIFILTLISSILIVFIELHSTLTLSDEPLVLSHSESSLRTIQLLSYMAERGRIFLNKAVLQLLLVVVEYVLCIA